MLQGLPYRELAHHQSLGNLSEGNISDTISESSDNATLLSLSREDLVALGAGPIREDVRVNRKKLESLILRERDNHSEKHYMDSLMERTNTYIQWPSRMKIGAKTKKDLYIRVYGHNVNDVNEAKNQILTDLGPHRDLRITLKMEISYTDHSHLIGCRGQTIRRVMEDTGCHIHFPDSNRMSKDHKSNQVTIAGSSIASVEQARSRVRELSPIIFQFTLPMVHSPYEVQLNPDANHIFIENIQSGYNVQVTIHPPNKLQQTSVSVKGCEVDAAHVKEAVNRIIAYFSHGQMINTVTVESTMEISSIQHPFVRAINDTNVHAIMMNTGAKIIFPDLSDGNIQQIKRSRVYISGEINCVYNARQQLIGCLPLRMIFDLSDDFQLDWDKVRQIGSELNVNVKLINRNRNSAGDRATGGSGLSSLPPPIPGRSRTVQLIAAERNTSNMFEVRRRILGGSEPMFQAGIPQTYFLRPAYPTGDMKGSLQYGNRLGPPTGQLPPLMLPTSPNMLSPVLSPSFWPPTPFGSPYCSPPIATCIVNNSNSNMSNNNGNNMGRDGPPGIGKMTLNLQGLGSHSHYGYNSLPSPSPINPYPPPEISINNMKHQMHLPLLDIHTYRADSTLNTPMSLGGTSTLSDFSPMSQHPGVTMVNALINDFGNMDLKRKAPGCERANTAPNLFANIPSGEIQGLVGSGSAPGSRSESPGISTTASSTTTTSQEDSGVSSSSTSTLKDDPMPDKVANPTNEKKYKAMQAMFKQKIEGGTRVPTSEWSGFGFSRTVNNLFPKDSNSTGGTEDECTSSTWTSEASGGGGSTGDQSIDHTSNSKHGISNSTKDSKTMQKTHCPLGHQQSNLLDFAATRRHSDKPPTDLASLFIQNGLEKYIDTFVSEEIDLDEFSTLTEGDLRTLGVSAYAARKRMLVIITQLACPQPNEDWH